MTMPRRPSDGTLKAKDARLDPVKVVEAVINDMHDEELERRLVDAGVAVYAKED